MCSKGYKRRMKPKSIDLRRNKNGITQKQQLEKKRAEKGLKQLVV